MSGCKSAFRLHFRPAQPYAFSLTGECAFTTAWRAVAGPALVVLRRQRLLRQAPAAGVCCGMELPEWDFLAARAAARDGPPADRALGFDG